MKDSDLRKVIEIVELRICTQLNSLLHSPTIKTGDSGLGDAIKARMFETLKAMEQAGPETGKTLSEVLLNLNELYRTLALQ